MKKIIATLCLLLATAAAQANSIADWLAVHGLTAEVSVGTTKFGKTDNSIWYQNGYHHTLDLQSPSYSLGLSGYLTSSTRWRVEAGRLGQVSTEAQAVSDANYNGVDGCKHPCETPVTVRTEGSIRGISFTLAPEFTSWGVRWFVEGGAILFWPSFTAGVSESPNTHMSWGLHYKEGPQLGGQFGGGVHLWKNVQFVLTVYGIDTKVSNPDAITNNKGPALNAKLRFQL